MRYFACGEYGEHTGRPHYHALLFNCAFKDLHRVGKRLFASERLARLWPAGQHALGECTGASANYIAQYSLKKQGRSLECDADGVVRQAPFLRMSTNPAIGARWLFRYADDLKGGFLVAEGRKVPIPRYYRSQLQEFFPVYAESLELSRAQSGVTFKSDSNLPARLADAEAIHVARKRLTESRSL
ncbi:MAG: replication initiator protein [Microviridae sp.]|nr:MAG: replication initiator protein [Microviridae sp.]